MQKVVDDLFEAATDLLRRLSEKTGVALKMSKGALLWNSLLQGTGKTQQFHVDVKAETATSKDVNGRPLRPPPVFLQSVEGFYLWVSFC